MSEQEKQQLEMEEGNLSTAEADNDSDDYDFVRLDQTTPNNCNSVVLQQQQNGNGTIWNPLGTAFSVDINELKLKMAALEAKNELLEGRLEKMELKGKIHELQQEAIGHKLKEAEAKAEMANNQLKSTIQAMQQEMANFELLAKEFKAKNNVKNHSIHIGSKWPFECNLCEKTFIRVDTLQTHIRQMHKHTNSSLKSESGSDECNPLDETTTMATIRARLQEFLNLDDKESTGGSSLGYGINSHQPFSNDANNNSSALSPGNAIALTGEMSTFYCEWQDCQNEFPSEETFVLHMNEVHVRAEQSPHFYCRWESCTRKEPFNAQYMLAQHVRKHCGEKPYICDHVNEDGIQCIKRYGRLENLKTHQRTHSGDRPYKCAYCNKMFSNASDCAKHQLRTHSSAKDFGCPVYKCAKQYTDPSSLRKHVFHEHGESVWLLAKANKEANKAKDYGLIGVRLDGSPFVIHPAGVSSNDEDDEAPVKLQTHNQIHFVNNKAAMEEKLRKFLQTISKD